jgi:uncharacterized membrane protein YhfC
MQTPLTFDPLLVLSFIIALIVDVGFPLLVGAWLVRRFRLRPVVFIYGAVVFVVAQMVLRLPLVQLAQAMFGAQIGASPVALWLWIFILSFTAGLFEETGRWLGYRWFFRREPRTWANALLYGAGHGGAEAILLVGLSVLSSLATYLVITGPGLADSLPAAQLDPLRAVFAGLQWWEPLLGGVERVLTLAFHISAAVLVLQVFVRRSLAWLGVAIAWHTFTNLSVIAVQQATRPLGPLSSVLSEGALLVIALVCLGIIRYFRPPGGVVEDSAPPLLSLAPAGATDTAAATAPVATRLSLAPAGEVAQEPTPVVRPVIADEDTPGSS